MLCTVPLLFMKRVPGHHGPEAQPSPVIDISVVLGLACKPTCWYCTVQRLIVSCLGLINLVQPWRVRAVLVQHCPLALIYIGFYYFLRCFCLYEQLQQSKQSTLIWNEHPSIYLSNQTRKHNHWSRAHAWCGGFHARWRGWWNWVQQQWWPKRAAITSVCVWQENIIKDALRWRKTQKRAGWFAKQKKEPPLNSSSKKEVGGL